MRNITILTLMIILFTSFKNNKNVNVISSECDIKQIYQTIEPDNGVKVLTSNGEIEEVELILIPTKIEEGTYKIEITRKGNNIYKLEGTNYYVETSYCFEFTNYDDAVLILESNYGFYKGKIIFEN